MAFKTKNHIILHLRIIFFFFPLLQVEDVVGCHVEDAVTFWAQVNSENYFILTVVLNLIPPYPQQVSVKVSINDSI